MKGLVSTYIFMSVMLLLFSLMMMMFFILGFNLDLKIFFEWEIFSLNSMELVYVVLLDWITLLFMSIVMFISSMVIYYSKSYMKEDKDKERFLLLVMLFVFSMMLMIISPNLVSIMLGWDGLGLVSFCLVIFYQNVKSYNSGMLTVLSNRIGDVMFLMSIALMLHYGSWNLIFFMDFMKENNLISLIGGLLIIAGFTKSAQIPFSAWLPAAMAAPTPVSALVHSSTLVTAGVYMMIRFFNFLKIGKMFKLILFLGLLTMFMSGVAANYEFDLKKIIALSTLSQLGLMMSILGQGYSNLAFFHLLAHAFFKALLFLCAGSLIHNFKDMQDIRFMGNLIKFLPLISISFLISNLALCGLPFLTGFYSKDTILDYFSMCNLNIYIYLIFYISMGLTVSYSVRLSWYCFFSNVKYFSLMNLFDNDKVMLKSIISLSMLSILMGVTLSYFLFYSFQMIFMSLLMKLMILMMISLGVLMGSLISLMKKLNMNFLNYFKNMFISSMWFLVFLSLGKINKSILYLGKNMIKILDFGWMEFLVSLSIFQKILYYLMKMQEFQKNNMKVIIMLFFMWMIMGVMLVNL
uniref:NADH-ubiquinone oxidoreductase chain 5 n=1 Tax=Psilotreta sp. XG-2021 TaxID=2996739 RepID=A0A9E8LPA6_9NEOP|nr:NADH dehydrogenase subunit 5 [Psilotreta sp. XG-2021]